MTSSVLLTASVDADLPPSLISERTSPIALEHMFAFKWIPMVFSLKIFLFFGFEGKNLRKEIIIAKYGLQVPGNKA